MNHVHAGIRDLARQTILLVGRVLEIRLPEEILRDDGYLALATAGSLASTRLEGQQEVGPPVRLPCARPSSSSDPAGH